MKSSKKKTLTYQQRDKIVAALRKRQEDLVKRATEALDALWVDATTAREDVRSVWTNAERRAVNDAVHTLRGVQSGYINHPRR